LIAVLLAVDTLPVFQVVVSTPTVGLSVAFGCTSVVQLAPVEAESGWNRALGHAAALAEVTVPVVVSFDMTFVELPSFGRAA
jgi:hypothetical protein